MRLDVKNIQSQHSEIGMKNGYFLQKYSTILSLFPQSERKKVEPKNSKFKCKYLFNCKR